MVGWVGRVDVWLDEEGWMCDWVRRRSGCVIECKGLVCG